jgi:hypothetical protein
MTRKSTYLVIAAELVVFHIVLQVEIEIMFLHNLNCIRDYELLQISFGFERISYKQFKLSKYPYKNPLKKESPTKNSKWGKYPYTNPLKLLNMLAHICLIWHLPNHSWHIMAVKKNLTGKCSINNITFM